MATFNPTSSTRLAPAWNAALALLTGGAWQPWTDVVTAMTGASDIKAVTASNLLHDGVRNGTFDRQGDHRNATRRIRLAKASR
ncbi:hypothetical protein J7I98_23780 [Streptomyces sp. ISL-98]|uniref:hypothetical protein n=1 Tax=Streptomyces sp. ISL-98 TaxID=2819192 RepID=UPI001BECA08D|nr:hypothetical protein [Streptomyces sp. ISL-98]MBT2508851.1 hypothetical protein [Streptomyces sp. ISL-98]